MSTAKYQFTTLPVQILRVKTAEGLLKRLNELKSVRSVLDTEIEMTLGLLLHQFKIRLEDDTLQEMKHKNENHARTR